MGYPITLGNNTFELLNPNTLGFRHSSFSGFTGGRGGALPNSAPNIELVTTNPAKLEKCPSTHEDNPSNDCLKILQISMLRGLYAAQSGARSGIITLIDEAKNSDDFSGAIDAAKQLETYFLDCCRLFAEFEAYARYLRSYPWGTKDKWRCCYSNAQLDDAKGDAGSLKNQAWQDALQMGETVKQIQALQAAVNDSTLSDLEVEQVRAETNYQIARTNQQIAQEGFVSSQLSLKEGAGKIVYVVMALVAAFLVYRFVIKK